MKIYEQPSSSNELPGVAFSGIVSNIHRIDPSVDDVSRVGLAVTSGEKGYDALLQWIYDNKI